MFVVAIHPVVLIGTGTVEAATRVREGSDGCGGAQRGPGNGAWGLGRHWIADEGGAGGAQNPTGGGNMQDARASGGDGRDDVVQGC